MKLELWYIAPYLPYGLKMLNTKSGKVITITGIDQDGVDLAVMETGRSYDLTVWPLKPLLIPLSELPEYTITHLSYLKTVIDSGDIQLKKFNDLIKQHYDVFGLIDNGLAINKLELTK